MPAADRRLRLLDLFAGCGGLTQGFVESGRFRPVGAVELDPNAAATYAVNFGEHVHVGDIRTWSRASLPLAEVVVGGPPCQGFSLLGSKDEDDPRNDLWRDYVRVLVRVRPAVFVLENVPQFLASRHYRSLLAETTGGALQDYELEAHVLDAADYGAAQRRRRAMVLGRLRGTRSFGVPEVTARTPVLSEALAGVLSDVKEVDLPAGRININGHDVAGAYRTTDLHVTNRPSDISLQRYRAVPPGGGRLDLPHDLRLPAWQGSYRGAADVLGRLRWDRPSGTIRTGFFRPEKGRFLHPDEDRALTHYEAAVLQGFPRDYLWCGSKVSIARQIGNAVPVPLASAVARLVGDRVR